MNKIIIGCGKEIAAGFDRIHGYPLHHTCGLIIMGSMELCEECRVLQKGVKKK